jgi:hypothetical protein
MNEKFLTSEEIEINLKKIKHRMILSVLVFVCCAGFGLFFLLILLGINPESELYGLIVIFTTMAIFLTGILVLYLLGLSPRHVIFYFNRIEPLNFDHISVNPKYVMSRKDEVYIMYSGFTNGIYFIDLNITGGQSLLYREPKKLPQFTIRLNKKITIEDFTFRVGEFFGFFKIPSNKGEFITGDAKVIFMPLATFSKSQGSTEKIHMMMDYVNGKTI